MSEKEGTIKKNGNGTYDVKFDNGSYGTGLTQSGLQRFLDEESE